MLPEVAADLAVLARLGAVADRVRLPLLALLPLLAPQGAVARLEDEAALAVEEASVQALHRSFSPAMAGNLTSTATPLYSPVPRSGRKAKRRH